MCGYHCATIHHSQDCLKVFSRVLRVNVGRLSVPQPSFRIQVKEKLECGESFVSLLDIGVQCDETSKEQSSSIHSAL